MIKEIIQFFKEFPKLLNYWLYKKLAVTAQNLKRYNHPENKIVQQFKWKTGIFKGYNVRRTIK